MDRNELSDNERCYQFLMDKIAMNPARFDGDNENIEKWGVIEEGYAIIYATAFSTLCKDGGFSRTSFLSWANRKGFLQTEKSGKKLDKICLESKFTTVLLSKCVDGAYKFETQANNSTAKSPMGAFDQMEIDNDIVEVMKALEDY